MYTGAALDTFFLIDDADTVLIIGDGIYRADLLTGTLQVGDGAVRTGLSTFAALFTFVGIDVSPGIIHGDGAEITGILAGLSHTLAAVIRHHIRGDGTLFTGRVDDLNYIDGILAHGAFAFCQAHSLFDDLALFIDTAAELGLGSRNHLVGKFLSPLFQSPLPGHLGHFIQHVMLYAQYGCVICYHTFFLLLSIISHSHRFAQIFQYGLQLIHHVLPDP